MNPKCLFALLAAVSVPFAVIKPLTAQSWTARDVPDEDNQVLDPDGSGWAFSAITVSADGSRLVTVACCPGPILTSPDFGATWAMTPAPSRIWTSVAASADGSKLVAVSYGNWLPAEQTIFTSTNSGATWTGHSGLSSGLASVASSADGTKLVAVGAAGFGADLASVSLSSDSGATWRSAPKNVATNVWRGVASSADGTKLVAVGYTENIDTRYIYLSSDSGVTWDSANAPGEYWSSVASSADGTRLVATAHFPGRIYTSTNSGLTWTRQPGAPPENWGTVASSADGTRLVAGGGFSNGQIYTSKDSGVTWVSDNDPPTLPTIPPQNPSWVSVASSADGNKLAALPGTLTGVYTLQFESALGVRFEVFPKTNQFFLCDDFQVVATVTNLSNATITDVAPVSPPTNGVNGVLRALGQAIPNLPQTIPPNGTVTFTWPFRAGHIGAALLHGQFTGTRQGTSFTQEAVAQSGLTVVRPDLVVNRTGDQSAADPSDGCADVDSSTPGRQTTLRAAIETANALPGKDTILFDLPTKPPQSDGPTISLTKPLPPITEACDIRGTSQPGGGWAGIWGYYFQAATPGTAALELRGDVSMSGLALYGFRTSTAVWLSAGANQVQGCRFGLAANGQATGNNGASILVTASGQKIGGAGLTQGNIFRGGEANPTVGILVTNSVGGAPLVNVVVEGNRFGSLDEGGSGKSGPGNSIVLLNAASCRIGGTAVEARNYFVGSSGAAVLLVGPGATDNDIIGNWFGLALDGSKIGLSQFNGYGIAVIGGAHHNRIGGTSAPSRNVISASNGSGVLMSLGAHDNTLEGNWIGLTGDGNSDAANEFGVTIWDGANNRIGGLTPGQRNVISGNLDTGIVVGRPEGTLFKNKAEDPGMRIAGGTLIQGNWIGLDRTGARSIPNGRTFRGSTGAGVSIARFAAGTVVGASTIGAKNVISGNQGLGIRVDAEAGTSHAIWGNHIGVSVDGLTGLPNNGSGIAVRGEPVVAIGGSGASMTNRIAFNSGPGIDLTRMKGGVPGLVLDRNLIYNNQAFGSILLSAPRSRNDKDDTDSGPNGFQNWPLLLNAFNRNGVTEVVADLSSFAPGVPVRVSIFRAADGGGDLLLAAADITTRSQPKDRYVLGTPLQAVGSRVTALATTAEGTSEFSIPIAVMAGPDSDGDGIPDALEGQVPVASVRRPARVLNDASGDPSPGDRNGDGLPDSGQANVTSVQVPDTEVWITVAAATDRALSDVVGLRALDLDPLPGANELRPGAVRFSLAGGTGTAEAVELWVPTASPPPTIWLGSDTGWLQFTNAAVVRHGPLDSVSFNLPPRPPRTAWTVALGHPRAVIEAPEITILPLELQTLGQPPGSPVPGYSASSADASPIPEGWVVPVRITLPDNPPEWRLETSVNLFDWEEVRAWPEMGATELELAWPVGTGSRFFRWSFAY